MQQTLANGWSRNVLLLMLTSAAHRRQLRAVTNFTQLLPAPHSDLARQTLKDPYIFDFLTLDEPFHERELETGLVRHLEKFLLELGQGFAFVGRQYRVEVDDSEFYIDLLFYHLRLRAFVAIDLKTGTCHTVNHAEQKKEAEQKKKKTITAESFDRPTRLQCDQVTVAT